METYSDITAKWHQYRGTSTLINYHSYRATSTIKMDGTDYVLRYNSKTLARWAPNNCITLTTERLGTTIIDHLLRFLPHQVGIDQHFIKGRWRWCIDLYDTQGNRVASRPYKKGMQLWRQT